MTDETHPGLPVAGYRPQGGKALGLVNTNKDVEEATLRILDALKADPEVDQRWLATGRTDIEKGWMAVNRSVFKPDRVQLVDEQAEPLLVRIVRVCSVAYTVYAVQGNETPVPLWRELDDDTKQAWFDSANALLQGGEADPDELVPGAIAALKTVIRGWLD